MPEKKHLNVLLVAQTAWGFLRTAWPIVFDIATEVIEAAKNGHVEASEGETIGAKVAASLGDLDIKVKGVDVLDKRTQDYLGRAFGRIIARTVEALRK